MIDALRTKALSNYFNYSSQFYYILTDLMGNCYHVNSLFLEQNGFAKKDIQGMSFSSLIPSGESGRYQAIIKECVANMGTPVAADLHHQLADGSYILVRWEFQVLPGEYNEADGIQCIGTRIREIQQSKNPVIEKTADDNERYKAYELSAQGVWRLDLEIPVSIEWPVERIIAHCREYGYMAECNDHMAKMYGLQTAADITGMKIDSLMNLDQQHQIEYMERFIQNGYSITNAETEEHDINGRKVYFLNNMTGIIEDGMLKRVWGTQQDITEKKKAQEQLFRSELFYRNLIGDSLDGILLTDSNGLISFASPSVEKILGYRPEDIVHTNTFAYVHPDDHALAIAAFQDEVMMEPITKFIDIRIKTKYGEWIYCNVRGHNMLYNPYIGRMVVYFQDTTQRKKTEQALHESEERYRQQAVLLSNVTDVIVTSDLANTITSWNRIAEETTGIKAEEAIGKNYRDVIPLDYAPYTREEVAATLAEKGIWRGESSFITLDGEKKVHLQTFSLVQDEQGKTTGIMVIGKDITGRKKIEAKLQESELFYRNLIAHSLDGIVLTDMNGIVTYGSPSIIKLSGYGVDMLVGRNVLEFIHPDDLQLAKEAFIKELKKESELNYLLLRLKHSNGNWVWCTIRAHNLLDKPGFNSMVIYFTDDTRRKETEDKLRESEQRFRHLISNLRTGVVLQDSRAKMILCNGMACELLGLSEEQLLGISSFDPGWEVIHEDGTDFPGHQHPVPVAIKTKQAVRDIVMGVYRHATKDRVWLLVNAEPILNDQQDIIHVVCSFADITEQKRLAQELVNQEIQKQKLLTQATIDGQENERKEIGKELHDNISQHLTTTRLYLEVAQEKAVREEVKEMIYHAHRELNDIINEIRNLSQSLVPPTLGDIGLIESIQDVCDSLKRTHTMTVDFKYRSFTEETIPDNMKLMLFRIFQEQVNNIIRHAGADHIHIRLQSDAELLELMITDNGKGFNPAMNGKKGVGFTNIANRAGLFNGKMNIRSAPGEGCAIEITVPLK